MVSVKPETRTQLRNIVVQSDRYETYNDAVSNLLNHADDDSDSPQR